MPRKRRGRLFSRWFRPSESPGDSGYDSPGQLSPHRSDDFHSGQRTNAGSPIPHHDHDILARAPAPSPGGGNSDSEKSSPPLVSAATRVSLPPPSSTSSMPSPSVTRSPPTALRSKSNLGSRRHRPSRSLATPDRFIPKPEMISSSSSPSSSPSSVRYRTAVPFYYLTTPERLLRCSEAAPDPFVFRSLAAAQGSHPGLPIALQDEDRHLLVDNGSGGYFLSGSNAPAFFRHLPDSQRKKSEDSDKYDRRLAVALELDPAARTLKFAHQQHTKTYWRGAVTQSKTKWIGTEWVNPAAEQPTPARRGRRRSLPLRLLYCFAAPYLRDDFFSSVMAYSAASHALFVALFKRVYAWVEGAEPPRELTYTVPTDTYVLSIAVSSDYGKKCILAVGCADGLVILLSLGDVIPRFEISASPAPASCVSWRPTPTLRPSKHPSDPPKQVATEDLLIGSSDGVISYYVVEWPDAWEVERDNWSGAVTLVSKIVVHASTICGLVWSPDGQLFASGGGDGLCCLFEVDKVLPNTRQRDEVDDSLSSLSTVRRHGRLSTAQDGNSDEEETYHRAALTSDHWGVHEESDKDDDQDARDEGRRDEARTEPGLSLLLRGSEKHFWCHGAAVKAIAFCPWQDGLVATGGGLADGCVHFTHTRTGAALATIDVGAQVTGLVWSRTRREIAVMLGHKRAKAHPYGIAVFSWPECKLVGAIAHKEGSRVVSAIHYPSRQSTGKSPPTDCVAVAVATSAAVTTNAVGIYDFWGPIERRAVGGTGCLGSDILESMDGIEKEAGVIR